MELSLSPKIRSLRCQYSGSPINNPLNPLLHTIFRPPTYNRPEARLSPTHNVRVRAMKRPALEGASDELNKIAAVNLDHAPARRQVRSAFMDFQQQLDHCLFKPSPVEIRTQEWYEMNSMGMEIFCKSWMPDQIKGIVCFCHGYGDTCTFFFEGIARKIAAGGYAVFAVDHPGFGLSDGLHGYIPSFDDLVENAIEQFSKIKARPGLQGLPRFIFGQSMGGAVALKVNLKEPHQWDGLILVAPMCKMLMSLPFLGSQIKSYRLQFFLYMKHNMSSRICLSQLSNHGMCLELVLKFDDVAPPEAVVKVGSLLSKVMPAMKFFPQKDLAELAFRDPKKREIANYNVICYNKPVRLKTGLELLKTTSEIESQLDKVRSPLLVIHGAADKVTDPMISKFLYEQASSTDKTLKLYEGGYHSILEGEPDDTITAVFDDLIAWLDSRCSSE